MSLPMRRFGFNVLWVVRLPWLGLGHARLETVFSCGYRLGGGFGPWICKNQGPTL